MTTTRLAAFLAAFVTATAAPSFAQQVQWTQTINLPKGHGLPKGITADILGIEAGDAYAEARPKLEKLAAEFPSRQADWSQLSPMQQALDESAGVSPPKPPLVESTSTIYLGTTPGQRIEASYVGKINIRREMPGSTKQPIVENLETYFSAPSSGHQVIGIERSIGYPTQNDQPRISELVAMLKQKFKGDSLARDFGAGVYHSFVFANGSAIVPKEPTAILCPGGGGFGGTTLNEGDIAGINPTGRCAVHVMVTFNYGISKDHASAVKFSLSDNERAKANKTADFAFFREYLKKTQERPGGAAPKL